jgi:hypothetical protein
LHYWSSCSRGRSLILLLLQAIEHYHLLSILSPGSFLAERERE